MTTVTNTSWVRQSFLLAASDLDSVDQTNRFFTTASLKYTDTTPGGNIAINPPAQFTRYADPKASSRKSTGTGMGISYSEMIDDHSQVIHMSFGVADYNSLTQFFSSFYNSGAGVLARTGRAPGAFYNLGKAAGFVVSVMSWRLLAFRVAAVGVNFFLSKPSTKFYYLKRTMPTYWQVVQTIVNQIAVNKGIIPRAGGAVADAAVNATLGDQYEFTSDGLTELYNLLPDIFSPSGGIDVYALANRAKRLAYQQQQNYKAALDTGNVTLASAITSTFGPTAKLVDQKPSFDTYLKNWFAVPMSQAAVTTTDTGSSVDDSTTESLNNNPSVNTGYFQFLEAEEADGSAFVSFRVNATGPVTDTFANQAAESELQNKINSMSSQNRSTRFDAENGNFSDGVVGKTVGHVLGAVSDFVSGAAAGMGFSGIASLGGSCFVDIPRHWQSSSANLSRSTYTMNLVSPYGNPISQLLNLHVPLAMIIAGTLPLATGPQSWSSPFICELYDRGRCQIRLGIIDSLAITRGTGNLGFDKQGNALGIDVTFSVLDLSSMVYLPISQGLTSAASETLGALGFIGGAVVGGVAAGAASGGLAALPGAVAGAAAGTAAGVAVGAAIDTVSNVATTLNGVFDGDNPFADYMAVLGGLGLADQIYLMRKLKLNLTMQMAQWRSWLTPAHFASMTGDLLPARLIGNFFQGVDKTI